MTDNRFYNYEDAMNGIREYLTLRTDGSARNLSLLITDGSKEVTSFDAKLHTWASEWLKNNEHVRKLSSRLALLQEKFDLHIYEHEWLGRMNVTVVIDHLTTGEAPAVLYVLRDTLMRLSEGYGNGMGSVHLFIVEASRI